MPAQLLIHRASCGGFNIKARIEPVPECIGGHATHTCNLAQRSHFSSKENHSRLPLIVGLLLSRSPSAVFGSVVAVVVDPIKGVTKRRPRPHVFKEVGERINPPVANPNTTRPVTFVVTGCSFSATNLHGHIGVVFWGVSPTNGVPVLRAHMEASSLVASATLNNTPLQFATRNDPFLTALASAQPGSLLHVLQDSQVIEYLTRKINSGLVWPSHRKIVSDLPSPAVDPWRWN